MDSDGAAGTITVSWSPFERQFTGSWNAESSGGDIALRLDGENIRGAWTADEMSPRTPNFRKLADLNWRRPTNEVVAETLADKEGTGRSPGEFDTPSGDVDKASQRPAPAGEIFPTPEAVLDRLSTCETFEDYVGLLSNGSINELAAIMLMNSASLEAWIQRFPNSSSGRLTEGSEEKIAEFKALLKDSMLEQLPAESIRSYRKLVRYYSNNLKLESGTDASSHDSVSTEIELTKIDLEAAVGVLKEPRQFVIDMSRLLMAELDDSMAASVRKNRRHWKVTRLGDGAAVANYVGPVDPEHSGETNLELRRFGKTWKIVSPVVDLDSPDDVDAKTPFAAKFVEPDAPGSELKLL